MGKISGISVFPLEWDSKPNVLYYVHVTLMISIKYKKIGIKRRPHLGMKTSIREVPMRLNPMLCITYA